MNAFLLALSSIFSYSLAETYAAFHMSHTTTEPFAFLMTAFFGHSIGFLLLAVLFYKLLKTAQSVRWTTFRDSFTKAILPLHLLLPVALLIRPMDKGSLLFEVAKCLLLLWFLQRGIESIQELTGWPKWKASLLVVGPFFIASGFLFMAIVLGTFLLFVGILAL